MRVLFWGTPEFATPALRALVGEGFEVVGVVTQPDRPVGRSRSTLQPSPVKLIAVDESLPLLQPERPRGEDFLAELARFGADLSVVVAYGHILLKSVIDLPRRPHAITPLTRRRLHHDLRYILKTRDAVKTITNYLSLRSELSFVCELLKVAATATTKVRTWRLNPDRRRRDDLFNRRKQQLALRAIDLHPHAISGCRE